MKLPRDLSGSDLVKKLRRLGYEITRQTGSHIRLTTSSPSQHHVTVPNHSPLKAGTLSAIINEVAAHRRVPRDELTRELFG